VVAGDGELDADPVEVSSEDLPAGDADVAVASEEANGDA
jgi:hypothetical protein